eukprot:8643966-Alexandrium_andersonii.AAC.1
MCTCKRPDCTRVRSRPKTCYSAPRSDRGLLEGQAATRQDTRIGPAEDPCGYLNICERSTPSSCTDI